jgi:hypothetical protein
MGFLHFSFQTAIASLNSINQLMFVMVKCGFGFKGLILFDLKVLVKK